MAFTFEFPSARSIILALTEIIPSSSNGIGRLSFFRSVDVIFKENFLVPLTSLLLLNSVSCSKVNGLPLKSLIPKTRKRSPSTSILNSPFSKSFPKIAFGIRACWIFAEALNGISLFGENSPSGTEKVAHKSVSPVIPSGIKQIFSLIPSDQF